MALTFKISLRACLNSSSFNARYVRPSCLMKRFQSDSLVMMLELSESNCSYQKRRMMHYSLAIHQSHFPVSMSSSHLLLEACLNNLWLCQFRYYAKKTDTGKAGGKKVAKKIALSNEELSEIINYDKMMQQMDEVMEQLKQDYIRQVSIRSNLGSFDLLTIETDDGKFPLKQVAQIVQKSPSLIAINAGAMPQYLPAIKTALERSGMNINPQQDKTTIFVPLPKVTREHRENLVKAAKMLSDRSKDRLKEIHNKYQKDAKKQTDVSEDLVRNVIEIIHDKLHEYQSNCEQQMKRKQEELLPAK